MGKRSRQQVESDTEVESDAEVEPGASTQTAPKGRTEGIDEANIVTNRRQPKPTYKVKARSESSFCVVHGTRGGPHGSLDDDDTAEKTKKMKKAAVSQHKELKKQKLALRDSEDAGRPTMDPTASPFRQMERANVSTFDLLFSGSSDNTYSS